MIFLIIKLVYIKIYNNGRKIRYQFDMEKPKDVAMTKEEEEKLK